MADPHVLTALHRKYSETLGRLHKCEDQVEQLRADLGHLEATIRLFKEDFNPRRIAPKRPRKANRYLRKGQGVQTALEVLRDATAPMSAREIALEVIKRRGITDTDADTVKAITSSLRGSLKWRVGNGVTECDGYPSRWALSLSS